MGSLYHVTVTERVLHHLQTSTTDETVIQFIDAANAQFKETVTAGHILVADESRVNSFHKKLKGRIENKT